MVPNLHSFSFYIEELIPETQTYVPFVPKINNSFPQKFCFRVSAGKPSFREIKSMTLDCWCNDNIFNKAHIVIDFDIQFLVIFIGS